MLPLPGYYWPDKADRGDGPDSLRSAFEAIGYELCSEDDVPDGHDRIALYVDADGNWSHAAKRFLDSDEWGSKLGLSFDIAHADQHCFVGSIYGDVVYYMKRPIKEVSHEEKGEGDAETNSPEPADQVADDV